MDDGSLGTRLDRYMRVGSAVTGLAARLAGQHYLGIPINQQAHAQALMEVLGNLKGPLMKVAQIVATIPDALPRDYVEKLSELQSNAPPMAWPFVRRRLGAELGPDWQQHFIQLDQQAAAAASLGQVHKAVRRRDGAQVAVKVQYPQMDSIVQADMNQLRLAFRMYEGLSNAIKTDDILAELTDRLMEELDYTIEAANIDRYRTILADQAENVVVPAVDHALTTRRLLTMEWLEGQSLKTYQTAPIEVRNDLARKLFHIWYRPFYQHGTIHADPHLGNYTVAADGRINLLDFGCVRTFPDWFVQAVIQLYRALLAEDAAKIKAAFQAWGFTTLDDPDLVAALTQWARLLYGPLLEDRVRTINDAGTFTEASHLAQHVHARLHEAGGVRPPREFVFFDRAAVGIGAVMIRLQAQLNWHQMFEEIIAKAQ